MSPPQEPPREDQILRRWDLHLGRFQSGTGTSFYIHILYIRRLNKIKTTQAIFKRSRKDSRKVLFLVTDGFSNGGDPTGIADQLKENKVTIFTIGIKNGNYKELYQLSSYPGEYYSYLLDSFNEFESLARRALHVGEFWYDYGKFI